MTKSLLRTELGGIKRRKALNTALLTLARFMEWSGAGFIAATYLSALAPEKLGPALFATLMLAGLALGVYSAFKSAGRGGFAGSDAKAAELLAGGDPDLANILITGADLEAWDSEKIKAGGADSSLVEASVKLASEKVFALKKPDLGPGPAKDLLVALLILAASVLTFIYGPEQTGVTVAKVLGGYSGKPVTLGNIQLTLRPPAYTGLTASVEEGGSGDFTAYPGTKIELTGILTEPVDGAILNDPGGVKVAAQITGDRLKVEWVAKKAGTYDLKFTMKGVPLPSEFGGRKITLVPDKPPEVELLTPSGDIEAMKVGTVEVSFKASDDFGLESARMILSGAEEISVPLKMERGTRATGETSLIPASYPKLGEGAYLSVEVTDNDTVNGPKKTVSKAVYVTFYSVGRLAREMGEMEARLLEAMLALLADHLENPAPGADLTLKLEDSARNVAALAENLLKSAQKNQGEELLRPAAVTTVATGLKNAVDGWLLDHKAGKPSLIAELERDIIFLDRLARELEMEQALDMGAELTSIQQDLMSMLRRGEDTDTLLKAVDQIGKMISEISEKLARRDELPDDFANADAVRDPPSDSLGEMLKDLKKALREGDRKKAAELAEKIMKELDKWMSDLEKAADQSGDSELSGKLDELSEKISRAMAEQERIIGQTRKTADASSRRMLEEMKDKIEAIKKNVRQKLEEISRDTLVTEVMAGRNLNSLQDGGKKEELARSFTKDRDEIRRMIKEMGFVLDASLGDALKTALGLKERIQSFGHAASEITAETPEAGEVARLSGNSTRLADEIIKDLRSIFAQRKEKITGKEKEELEGLSGNQKKLTSEIKEIEEKFNKLAKESPFIGNGPGKKAGQAGQSSGRAGTRLGEHDPYGAGEPQMETMEKLGELAGDMEKMKSGSRPGGGMPRGQRRGGGQGRNVDRSHVEIPGESDAEQLRKLREEVMKTMREGRYPEKYREEVERYFEGLIR